MFSTRTNTTGGVPPERCGVDENEVRVPYTARTTYYYCPQGGSNGAGDGQTSSGKMLGCMLSVLVGGVLMLV